WGSSRCRDRSQSSPLCVEQSARKALSYGSARGSGRAKEDAMAGEKVVRTLHVRFMLPAADPAQLSAMIKSAMPFYEFFATTRVRLLQNADDPGRFVQVIDYETDQAGEINRQRIASDPRMQGFIQAWRAMLPGAVEIDVYEEV